MTRRLVVLLAMGLVALSGVVSAEGIPSWATLVDGAKGSAAAGALVDQARKAAAEPIVRRAQTLKEVGQNRTWLDGRSNALEDEIRETFALAMSDFAACHSLARELPLLAAAYRLTGETVFKNRVIEQLEEMSEWSPLQRPGWTCYTPGSRLPADGKDVIIEDEGQRHVVRFGDIRMSIESSEPVEVSQVKLPDHTLEGHTAGEDPGNVHTCVVVRSREKVEGMRIVCRLEKE